MTIGSGMPSEGFAVASTTAFSKGKQRILMTNYFVIDPQFLPLRNVIEPMIMIYSTDPCGWLPCR